MPSKTSTQPCIRSFSQAHCQFNPRPHAAEVSLLKRQLNEDPQSSGLLRSSQSSLSTPVHTSAGTAAVNLNLSKLAKVVKQPGSALLFVSTPLAKRASPHTKTNPRRAQNCQRAAWNPAEHKVECAAFKRWNVTHAATKRPGHKVAIPETPVRALARLMWSQNVVDPERWKEVQALQSHRKSLTQEQLEYFARLAASLAQFIGDDFATTFKGPDDLLDFVCSFPTNSFALTLPDLTTVGVAISPAVALANHSCAPNAVVVFPNGPLKKDGMHIVAIKDLQPDEEILTAYIDIANPRRIRQDELRERYYFNCDCDLCTRKDWVDPREALSCKNDSVKGCDGMASLPDLERDEDQNVICNKCRYSWSVSGKDLAEEMRVGEQVLQAMEASDGNNLSKHLLTCLKSLGSHLHQSSYFLFQLLRGAHLACIDDGLFADALQIAQQVTSASSNLYPPGHPSTGIQMLTMAKLMQNVDGAVSQAGVAMVALKSAITALQNGFGKDSECEREAKEMLVDLERTMYLFQQNAVRV